MTLQDCRHLLAVIYSGHTATVASNSYGHWWLVRTQLLTFIFFRKNGHNDIHFLDEHSHSVNIPGVARAVLQTTLFNMAFVLKVNTCLCATHSDHSDNVFKQKRIDQRFVSFINY